MDLDAFFTNTNGENKGRGEGAFYRNLTKNEPLLVGRKLTKKKGRLGMKKGLYKNRQGIFYGLDVWRG